MTQQTDTIGDDEVTLAKELLGPIASRRHSDLTPGDVIAPHVAFLRGVAGPNKGHYGVDVILARGFLLVADLLMAVEQRLAHQSLQLSALLDQPQDEQADSE